MDLFGGLWWLEAKKRYTKARNKSGRYEHC
jgi:hypothetical protein